MPVLMCMNLSFWPSSVRGNHGFPHEERRVLAFRLRQRDLGDPGFMQPNLTVLGARQALGSSGCVLGLMCVRAARQKGAVSCSQVFVWTILPNTFTFGSVGHVESRTPASFGSKPTSLKYFCRSQPLLPPGKPSPYSPFASLSAENAALGSWDALGADRVARDAACSRRVRHMTAPAAAGWVSQTLFSVGLTDDCNLLCR